ncbi:glycosyltransferase [Gordonia sp. NPDC058843]|uniref:glycosyltransferase n=1 Tax=Gordonia sp. NPDC058843 TaxID=3346648 RepID=UPI0036A0988A
MSGMAHQLQGRFVASVHQMPWVDSVGMRGRVEDVFQRIALRNAVFVTSPSAAALEFLVNRRVLTEEQAVVEANILPLNVKGATAVTYDAKAPLRLLFCGRLERQKGLDRLMLAIPKVGRPIHVLVAGSGSQDLELRELVRRVITPPHTVEFLGYVSDVGELIDEAHLAIMPSRSELEPVFVWECWARGRAVIASAIQAFADLSRQGPLHLFEDQAELVELLETADSTNPLYISDFSRAVDAVSGYKVDSRLTQFLNEEG